MATALRGISYSKLLSALLCLPSTMTGIPPRRGRTGSVTFRWPVKTSSRIQRRSMPDERDLVIQTERGGVKWFACTSFLPLSVHFVRSQNHPYLVIQELISEIRIMLPL